ncbi:hypothetical protein HanRHA438_Chr12g0549481 [Helianthus annuus]|uniref:Uncharacterized protein n=1 Tax=Helianthus annuus TaxID=4232 RepID=A0A9K3MVR2_HELAN|nr:hypothetical protein HanXRQr2_Chr12g0538601 [Helianthus annuus]KAJ0489185.1 hypothetical protein HanHA300_Chr12g0441171 [Helianthus annuus]KAJ0505061.1 hypothetical protein HanHA89_Chr12g0466271 [Helianthus annuus]KAJ0674748.1 hypothetical protein HanLR1_Chr12g0443421 [Helianthus annuus]KAJ0862453.1 hypothetical protein HanPSC8_Chr12g0518421 [Helianthus annuus]
MTSLVGPSVFPLNQRNVCYPLSGYCKSGKKIETFSIFERRPVCYSSSIAPQNLKTTGEFCPSRLRWERGLWEIPTTSMEEKRS